jgi:hypothetical protein
MIVLLDQNSFGLNQSGLDFNEVFKLLAKVLLAYICFLLHLDRVILKG